MTPPGQSNYWRSIREGAFVTDFKPPETLMLVVNGSSKLRIQVPDITRPLDQVLQDGKYTTQVLKEYVFEEVRRTEFPEKPSRKRCMFLFDLDLDPLAYASRFGWDAEKMALLEVEIGRERGRLHRGHLSALNVSTHRVPAYEDAARAFWGQEPAPGDEDSEILYEGAIRITRVLRQPKAGP